jgi:hypothetical protein
MVQQKIADRWNISQDSVSRHLVSHHVPRNVKDDAAVSRYLVSHQVSRDAAPRDDAAPSEEEDLPILDRLRELIGFARTIMQRAQETNQFTAAINGVRELSRIFELIAKLTGQLDESGTRVNIAIVQQQQRQVDQELQLSRLSVEERQQLRHLFMKMQNELPAGGIDGNGTARLITRSD